VTVERVKFCSIGVRGRLGILLAVRNTNNGNTTNGNNNNNNNNNNIYLSS